MTTEPKNQPLHLREAYEGHTLIYVDQTEMQWHFLEGERAKVEFPDGTTEEVEIRLQEVPLGYDCFTHKPYIGWRPFFYKTFMGVPLPIDLIRVAVTEYPIGEKKTMDDPAPLTETELSVLNSCTSEFNWDVFVQAMRDDRKGELPSDWLDKVMRSGLARRVSARWGAIPGEEILPEGLLQDMQAQTIREQKEALESLKETVRRLQEVSATNSATIAEASATPPSNAKSNMQGITDQLIAGEDLADAVQAYIEVIKPTYTNERIREAWQKFNEVDGR